MFLAQLSKSVIERLIFSSPAFTVLGFKDVVLSVVDDFFSYGAEPRKTQRPTATPKSTGMTQFLTWHGPVQIVIENG
jgi:hypothetical protein